MSSLMCDAEIKYLSIGIRPSYEFFSRNGGTFFNSSRRACEADTLID